MSDSTSTEILPENQAKEGKTKRWFPLESNPEVMNKFLGQMGFTIDQYCLTDVFSTEEWALGMVPKPVMGVLFLYPITENTEIHSREEMERIEQEGQNISSNVYYMKQTVGNACGTIGLLHAIANIRHLDKPGGMLSLNLLGPQNSYLRNFFHATEALTPEERAKYLEEDNALESFHVHSAQEGQTEANEESLSVNKHFISFVHVDGYLYELDGRKKFPINHGPTTMGNLLENACRIIQGFFDRDPDAIEFTILALARKQTEEM